MERRFKIVQKTTHRKDKKLHNLRKFRDEFDIRQEDFAVLLGYKKSNYCQKELGKMEFKLDELLKIQKAINDRREKVGQPPVTLDEIFK
jgi:DNA-binding XRE family transcriptional regulator